MLIEDSTALKLSCMFSFSKSNIETESLYSEAIIRIDKSIDSMASMTNVSKNMEPNQFGSFLQKSSLIFHFQPLLKMKYLVFMVGYPLKLSNLIKSNQ